MTLNPDDGFSPPPYREAIDLDQVTGEDEEETAFFKQEGDTASRYLQSHA